MAITPVTPQNNEQMVPTTTGIIFDATESVTSVEVNNVVVWSGGAPQNGWFGYTVVHPGGTRYIFDPPSAFNVGDLKTVEVFGGVTTLTYQFVVGLRQITFTDDASVPRVAEGGPASPPVVTPYFHLKLDDAAGPPVDEQATVAFTVLGAPTWQQTGPVLPALKGVRLNGSPDALQASPTPAALKSQKFSLSGWFSPSSVSAQRCVASAGRSALKGWTLRILATNFIEFRAFNGVTGTSATSTTICGVGQYHHVVVVVDMVAAVMKLYVDSNKEAEVTPAFASIVYEALIDFFLGNDPVSDPEHFQGSLDQWKFYDNIALTDGQVSVLFQESTGPLRTPWVGYSRTPGNIYIRKDEPLTSEVLMVPGDKVDIGYDEANNEIEITYIHNGKVFIVTGQASENPSTLTQPSILKANFKTGSIGESPNQNHSTTTFPPLKYAAPADGFTTGDAGDSPNHSFASPPTAPNAIAFLGSPVAVVIAPSSSSLITSVLLFKRRDGATVFLASFPYSQDLQVYLDPTYVDGDRYITQAIYGDPGAPARQRLTSQGADAGATNGDFFVAGNLGDSPNQNHATVTFPPLKYAVPTDGPLTTGDVGHTGESAYVRAWYPPNGVAAAMAAAVGEHVLITGLSQMSAQHLGLGVTVSGASNSANNGTWPIVEIVSTTSVRVRVGAAPGADANNGALTWAVSGPTTVTPASFIGINSLNIGVGA